MKPLVPKYFDAIAPYIPGKPISELEREYGISGSIKLASNENPIGPSKKAVQAAAGVLKDLHRYPDGAAHDLVLGLSQKIGCKTSEIVLGNGSDEVIEMLAQVFLSEGDEALMSDSSFLMYEISVRAQGAVPVKVALSRELGFDLDATIKKITDKTRMIFINTPLNPTGAIIKKREFEDFLEKLGKADPRIIVVMDEAYIEFVRDTDCATGLNYLKGENIVVTLRTFSKLYGLAGLRIGYGVMPKYAAELLNRIRPPFNTSIPAQAAALAALDDKEHVKNTLDVVHDGLDYLFGALKELPVTCYSTQANFFLIDLGQNAGEVYEKLLRKGVIVRPMTSYGFPDFIRVSVGLKQENERFIRAFKEILT